MRNLISPLTGIETDYATVMNHAGAAEIGVGVLRASGRDARRWLHKIVTADVEHLAAGQGQRGALLDAKGHFVADFVILAETASFLLLTEPSARAILFENLRRYIIREKVQLDDASDAWHLYTVLGPESDANIARAFGANAPASTYHFVQVAFGDVEARLIRAARARVPTTDVLVPARAREKIRAELNLLPISEETLEMLRVEVGNPRFGVDFDSTTLALEIPDVMQVRVDQGCYVGQEVVARIAHRGHVNRHLCGLKIDGDVLPTRGAKILSGGDEVGALTSVAYSPKLGARALGYVRREVEIGARVAIAEAAHNLRAEVVELPFTP